jgi:hypothetical protein
MKLGEKRSKNKNGNKKYFERIAKQGKTFLGMSCFCFLKRCDKIIG